MKFLIGTLKKHCPMTACGSPLKHYAIYVVLSVPNSQFLYFVLAWVKAANRASESVTDLRKVTVMCQ